jgi:hypothetical protein
MNAYAASVALLWTTAMRVDPQATRPTTVAGTTFEERSSSRHEVLRFIPSPDKGPCHPRQ